MRINPIFADDTQEPRYHEELFASCEIEGKFEPGTDQYILEQFKKSPIDQGLSWVWRRKLRSTENGRGSERYERLGWIDSFVTGTAEHPSLGIALRSPSVRWAAKTIHIYSEGKPQNETIILIPDRDRALTQKTPNCKINHDLMSGKAPPFEEPNKYPC